MDAFDLHAYPPPDSEHRFVPHSLPHLDDEAVVTAGRDFAAHMANRRSIRMFSDRPVPREAIEAAVTAAASAPSGAHMQPWTFVVVGDPDLKADIRAAAEEEERENYEGGRIGAEWRDALAPLGTDWRKPFLERAPWIVVLFEQRLGTREDGSTFHHYYVKESVGIAAGMFITALHTMGLATLPHTPSPMAFLTAALGRPPTERPFAVFPVGFPAPECVVPDLERKALDEVSVWLE
jgi:nitroreductase